MGLTFDPSPKAALPTTTFDSDVTLFAGDEVLHIAHVEAAHTDTDVYLHLPASDVIVTGDLWFNGFFPFIDYSAGGSVEGMIAAGKKITALATDKTKIVPGHGPVGTKDQWVKFITMLEEANQRVAAAIAKGATEQEVSTQNLLSDLDPEWGQRMFTGNKFAMLLYRCQKKR